jgi:hypothetical protein
MFQLSKEEAESSRSQFVMLNEEDELSRSQFVTLNGRGHNIKHLPYAFTENGIAMLSGVLRSQQAVNMNIQIMRAFVAMRRFLASHAHPNLSKRTTAVRLFIVRKKCQTQPKKCQTRPKK